MGQSTTRINRWAACEAMSPVGSTLCVFFLPSFLPSLTLLLTSVLPCFRVSLARLVVVVLVVALLCLRLGLLLVSSAPPSSATKRGHFRTTLDRNGILVWKPENPKHFPDKQTNQTKQSSSCRPTDRCVHGRTIARCDGHHECCFGGNNDHSTLAIQNQTGRTMVEVSPALLLTDGSSPTGASGGSVVEVILHPLVFLSILDHHTRRQEVEGRVIGTLLGRRDGDKVCFWTTLGQTWTDCPFECVVCLQMCLYLFG